MATLKINIKQHVTIQQTTGTAGYYSGLNPQSLTFVPGTLPQARQWPNYGKYTDVTTYISDAQTLTLKWSEDNDEFGNTISEDGKGQKQSSSGSIIFESYAFELIKKWLIDDISAKFNSIDVMIEDVECGRYLNWQIKSKDIVFCEDANCSFDISISQVDDPLTCIQRTLINDNWQGWFQQNPSNNKKHPRFSYCNEIKPNSTLIIQMVLFGLVISIFTVIAFIIGTIYNIIAAVINVVISIINFIKSLGFGGGSIDPLPYFSYGDFIDAIGVYFTEMMGCGREHPAPLIQDYISNVCTKCGVAVNADTAPLFFADTLTLETSNRGQITVANPHVRACYLMADRKRGIRRFENLNLVTGYTIRNLKDWYLEENAPNIFLDKFLDQLKPLYNYEWRIRNVNNSGILTPTLFIFRKDQFRDASSGYLYDVSMKGADRYKVIEGICYEQNGTQTAAMLKGIYQLDAADTCGNEATSYMNDSILFGNIDNNPNLIDEKIKNANFGATRFTLDGVSNDYRLDALQTTSSIMMFIAMTGLYLVIKPIFNSIVVNMSDFGDYALLLKDDVITLPKILIWDGGSIDNARAVRQYYATANNGAQPQINPAYNLNTHSWDTRHRPDTFVIGSNLTPATSPYGSYRVADISTTLVNITRPAMLPNYPMYFAHDFYDTLWDWFHFIDDPNRNVILDRDFNFKIENCCPDLKRLKVFDAAGEIQLGAKVKLGDGSDGVIREISVSYKTSDRMGQFVEIRGKC